MELLVIRLDWPSRPGRRQFGAAIKWLEQVNIVFEACSKRRPLESRARRVGVLFDGNTAFSTFSAE